MASMRPLDSTVLLAQSDAMPWIPSLDLVQHETDDAIAMANMELGRGAKVELVSFEAKPLVCHTLPLL